MCKRSLCFVSGHLQSNCHLFFVSSYYGLDFLLSGFERAEGINSQMKGQKKKKKKKRPFIKVEEMTRQRLKAHPRQNNSMLWKVDYF